MTGSNRSTMLRTLIASALTVALSATIQIAAPSEAAAATRAKTITRKQVIKRSVKWVRKRVPYSQSRYYQGYRQDCSGFVSMAWALGKSYTTRSLPSVSKRISVGRIRTGDAVLTPGHVTIFGGWKNKRLRTYYAYEARTWGKPAARTVRKMRAGSKILRRPGIRDAKRVVRKVAPKPAPSTVKLGVKPAPSIEPSVGLTVPSVETSIALAAQ